MPNFKNSGEIILFVKNPEPGKVKTRLAQNVGVQVASQLYSHMSRVIFWRLQAAKFNITIAFHPAKSKKNIQHLFPGAHLYLAQATGNLGNKMYTILQKRAFHSPKLLIVGTDCIDLTANDCKIAFQKMDRDPVVLGPAQDGGYYLIGMRSETARNSYFCNSIFQNISWSTSRVFQQTTQRLRALKIDFSKLSLKSDIDTAGDLHIDRIKQLFGLI